MLDPPGKQAGRKRPGKTHAKLHGGEWVPPLLAGSLRDAITTMVGGHLVDGKLELAPMEIAKELQGTQLEEFGDWLVMPRASGPNSEVWHAFDIDGGAGIDQEELSDAVHGYISQTSADERGRLTEFLSGHARWHEETRGFGESHVMSSSP